MPIRFLFEEVRARQFFFIPPNKWNSNWNPPFFPFSSHFCSLPNVKYLFLFSRGLRAHCLILDSYQRSFQFDLLSLFCLLLSASFSVTETLVNSAYKTFHFITLFLLLYHPGDKNLIMSPLWLWHVLKVTVSPSPVNCSGPQVRDGDGSISHCDCSLGLLKLQDCASGGHSHLWNFGRDLVQSSHKSRREMPLCWVPGLDLIS